MSSIQFNSDGTVHSNEGTFLNKGVQNPSAISDSQKANIGITTRTGGLTTFNSGIDGPATRVPPEDNRRPDG